MLFRFVAGNNFKHALDYGKKNIKLGVIPIINYITENNKDNFNNVLNEYTNLLKFLDSSYMIALKLSSLNFNKPAAYSIADICKEKNIKLIIDAEEDKNIEQYRNIVNFMIRKYNNSYSNNFTIIKTYQMYRKDSLLELYDDIKYFNKCNCLFSSKLVRGAYYNSEYKEGHLFNKKEDTDNNYNLGIIKCDENKTFNNIIASHNIKSIELAKKFNKYNDKFIIANLMGMNQNYMDNLNNTNIKKATYIPYGPYKEMIPYLTRRLYENMDTIKYMYK
jgi:hypothetical protein